MTLYDASGNPLDAATLRSYLSVFSSGEENTPRVYNASGEEIAGRGGAAARDAINQSLADMGFEGGGFRGDAGQLYIPLDDPNKVAQAQQLGALQNISGVNVANYNDMSLRGPENSGALFQNMPQTGFVQDILTNPAFLTALGVGAAGSAGLLGGAPEATTVTGGGIGGGAGGVIGSPGLLDYSMTGTLGGGVGTAAAGGAADALAAGGGAVGAAAPDAFSLASGVGGGLGGSATLGASALPYSLGSGLASGIGSAVGGGAGGVTGSSVGANLGAASGVVGAGSALSRILDGTATSDDYLKAFGSVAPAALGYLGAGQQANAAMDISNNLRADREPALNAFNSALQNPNTYYQSAPAQGAVDSVLRKLSVNGNPADNPGSLAQAAAYNLGGYNDYLRALTPAAYGTASTEANTGLVGANAQGGQLSAIGYGLGSLMNPTPDISSILRQINQQPTYGLNIGGMSYGGRA